MRIKHLATFTQNLKVIKSTVFFFGGGGGGVQFILWEHLFFLPQRRKLLGPERLMPLKLLGMNRFNSCGGSSSSSNSGIIRTMQYEHYEY